ncbi:MAG: (2Fe-2S)-binding protein [Verrucomicrobiae bacterium]|nr:(2Fe-2S)-binding protein [Verrucomicrobiae bacterium]
MRLSLNIIRVFLSQVGSSRNRWCRPGSFDFPSQTALKSFLQSTPDRPAASPLGRPAVSLICHCLGISESDVRDCISLLTHPTVEEVGELTGAGTGCTGCQRRIQRVLEGKPAACGRFGPCDHCGNCRAVCGCETEPAPVLCRSHCQPPSLRR